MASVNKVIIVGNLVADLVAPLVDPRIRLR